MDELTSTRFRQVYASLKAPVVVTVNGHPIGTYQPIMTSIDSRAVAAIRPGEPVTHTPVVDYHGQRFNSRPFTPVPKHK